MKISTIIKEDPVWTYMMTAKETRRVADLLEKSKEFEEKILYLRDKYKIPKNGYPFDQLKHPMESILFDTIDDFFEETVVINRDILKLPYYWWGSIAYFAFYNVLITPERIPIEVRYIKSEGWDGIGTHIIIKEKMSRPEIHKRIDEEWDNIEREMKPLPEAKGHKMLRSELAKEIAELKDSKGKKYKEIADTLQKKYVDSELYDLLSEDYVKTLYHRWMKKK